SPAPSTSTVVSGGKQLVWHLSDVPEAGKEISFNVRLNGLQPNETRPATGPESISFVHPYNGKTETQNLQVPSVTGFAPLSLAVTTDQPAYNVNSAVSVTEAIGNVGTTNDGITTELVYNWLPGAVSTAGQLIVTIPDAVASGSVFHGHVFFDVIDYGFKPVSLFNIHNAAGGSLGLNGIRATYGYLDTAHMSSAPGTPEGIVYLGAPVMSIVQPTTQISAPAPPRPEFWGTHWTGQLYVPTTGTYQFLLGSDDGSWFYLDNQLLLAEPGNHGTFNVTTSIALTAGFHPLRGEMFNWGGPYNFYVLWAPPGQGFTAIPSNNLYQQPPASNGVTLGAPSALANGTVSMTFQWN